MANGLKWTWTIFCQTEGCNVIAVQKAKPTVCPNDSGHTIDSNSLVYEVAMGTNVIYDPTKNQGFYSVEGINFSCPANTTTTYDQTYDYDIILVGGSVISEDENAGDMLTITMTPNLAVGVLTAAGNTSDTTLTVSSTAITNLVKGCNITIAGDEYVVKTLDLMNSRLGLASALITNYSIATPVLRNLYVVKNMKLPTKMKIDIGITNPSRTFVPAGSIFRFTYVNASPSTAKNFNFIVEHV